MPLFGNRQRNRQEALRRGERLFDFYDSCGRRGYDEYRMYVDLWLSEMPYDARAEIIARMRNGSNREFQASQFELLLHATLVRLGHDVVVHPRIPNRTTQPDFRADHLASRASTYVEATTINPPVTEDAERNREDPVYNAIDKAKLPRGCCLGYERRHAGPTSPRLRELVRSVEAWALANASRAIDEPPIRLFEFEGWAIELQLFAGGSGTEPPTRAIGAMSMGAGWIAPHQDLRSALESKSGRYGDLDAPYLVAVADAKDQMWGHNEVIGTTLEALLGDEAVEVVEGHPPRDVRMRNGFWFAGGKPRNQNVSAVLVFPSDQLWTLRAAQHQPVLAINHWAQHPLPEVFLTLPRVVRDGKRWKSLPGASLADVLELPHPWPPEP